MEYSVSRSRSLITTCSLDSHLVCFHRHLVKPLTRSQFLSARSSTIELSCVYRQGFRGSTSVALTSLMKTACPVLLPFTVHRLRCVGNTASPFESTGGGGGLGGEWGGGGEGGDDGSDSGDVKSKSAATRVEDASADSSDVIILDVGGMTCGGCVASVKRILENQSQVTSASVNLTTETAVIWPISEAKAVPNWQKELGDALAKHLTNCGFTSSFRGQEAIEGDLVP